MITLLLCALLGQEDAKIAAWIEQLADDEIEVRDRAFEELVKAGAAAVPKLKEASKHPSAEVRGRAAEALAEMERREQMKQYDSGPSLVTLKRENAKLGEVLEAIRAQSRTRLSFGFAPEADLVSVEFDKMPFFKAVDSLCRKHGGIVYGFPSGYSNEPQITVSKGRFVDYPAALVEQFVVRLNGVSISERNDFRAPVVPQASFDFRWCWEKGTRPLHAGIRIEELRDDTGRSYIDDVVVEERAPFRFGFGWGSARTQQAVSMNRVPPEGATAFAVIKGSLEIEVPDRMDVILFEDPSQKIGTTVRGIEGEVRLVAYERDASGVQVKVEARPAEFYEKCEVKLVGKDGKEYASHSRSSTGDGEKTTADLAVRVGEKVELSSLRLAAPLGTREKKIPFEFKDVRFR